MRSITLGLAVIVLAVSAQAQTSGPKLECRDLASTGNFINANETVVNGSACHVVPEEKPVLVAAAIAPAPAASTPSAPATTGEATVYFYRPRRFQGSALKPSVFVDDARVGKMHNGDSIKYTVSAGDHRIYSTDKSTGMELDAKAGQTYYVRIDIQVGAFKGHGGVTLVDPQEGKYEASQAAHNGADKDE